MSPASCISSLWWYHCPTCALPALPPALYYDLSPCVKSLAVWNTWNGFQVLFCFGFDQRLTEGSFLVFFFRSLVSIPKSSCLGSCLLSSFCWVLQQHVSILNFLTCSSFFPPPSQIWLNLLLAPNGAPLPLDHCYIKLQTSLKAQNRPHPFFWGHLWAPRNLSFHRVTNRKSPPQQDSAPVDGSDA